LIRRRIGESSKGRRSVCYDQEALESRKENQPQHSAIGLAMNMGIELLMESGYEGNQQGSAKYN
jgi:hypothetical protein